MKTSTQICTVLGILVLVASGTEGYKCYECDMCDKPSNPIECAGVCMKIDAESGEYKGVFRMCSAIKLDTGCAEYSYNGVKANRCICDKDLCNGSPVTWMSTPMLLILTGVAAMLYRLI